MINSPFASIKDMFASSKVSAEVNPRPFLCSQRSLPFALAEQTIVVQPLPLHLISALALLDSPSNPAKHKKIGD